MVEDAGKILDAPLTDWQKVDALNLFVVSRVTYHLGATTINRTWAAKTDSILRKMLKKCLRLPTRTISTFFHTSTAHGGLGLKSIEDMLDTIAVSRLSHCLTSPDKRVSDIAWHQLHEVAKRRRGGMDTLTKEDLSDFLNSMPSQREGAKGDVRSLWSVVRKSIKRLDLSISLDETGVAVTWDDISVRGRKPVSTLLRRASDHRRLQLLLAARDQGRSFSLISASPDSSHWIPSGAFTSFAEYRFAIRGRLNLLPTRAVVRKCGKPHLDATCQKCHQARETLTHTLNACTPNTGLMRERHNAILHRLVKAVPTDPHTQVFLDQKMPGSPGLLRPDLVVIRPESVAIVDVTVPMETDQGAFEAARAEKDQKYSDLVRWAKEKHPLKHVTYSTFVVGSLGSWDPSNTDAMQALAIRAGYKRLFRKLCCSEAIKGSLKIWKSRSTISQ